MKYTRICQTLLDKGKLVDSNTNIYDHLDLEKDCYSSVYYYNEDHFKIFQEKQSIAGIVDVVTDKLVFDFDSKNNIEISKNDAENLINKLINEGINPKDIQLAFSGNKGFSIVIWTTSELSPEDHKTICKFLCSDLQSWDTNVYNASRIFRTIFSKHQVSGLYKMPIKIDEFFGLTVEEIKERAKDVSGIDKEKYRNYYKPIDLPEKILALKALKEIKPERTNNLELALKIEDLDFRNRPSFLSPSRFVLHSGFFDRGERSAAAMILASTYKKAGFNKEDSYRLLKSVMEREAEIYKTEKYSSEELWNNVLSVVYGQNWNGGIYSDENTELLGKINAVLPEYLKDVEKKSSLVRNDFLLGEFQKFLDDIDKNTIKTGLKEFDKKVKIMSSLSFGILGAPGSSKSSIAMNMLSNCSKNGDHSIYLSLDMSPTLVTYRQMQMKTGLCDDQLKEMWRNEKQKFLDIYSDISENMFKNVHYSFAYGSNTEDIKNEIINFEERTGKKIRLVVVDYLESVSSDYADPSVAAGVNAQKLTNIAMELNVAMIILLQTQKSILPGQIIEDCRKIKNSSLIEQSLSGLIGIARLGQVTKYAHLDTSICCTILKNRLGSLGKFDLGWDGNYTRVRELNDQDKINMAEIERLKAEEQEERQRQFGGQVRW